MRAERGEGYWTPANQKCRRGWYRNDALPVLTRAVQRGPETDLQHASPGLWGIVDEQTVAIAQHADCLTCLACHRKRRACSGSTLSLLRTADVQSLQE